MLTSSTRGCLRNLLDHSNHLQAFARKNLIEDSAGLIAGMNTLGYKLKHRWTNPEKQCNILDQPDRSVDGYTSFQFELT